MAKPNEQMEYIQLLETALLDFYRSLNYVLWVATRLNMTRCDEIRRLVDRIEKKKGAISHEIL